MTANNAQPERPPWLPWSAFPLQSRFASIGGKRIHYVDEGSGPALLLVSAGQWSFMFRDVILRLRGQFRCLTLDFPGCGLSPDSPGHDHGVPTNAQVLEAFIDALDLQDSRDVSSTMSAGRSGFWSPSGARSDSVRW